MTPAMATPPMAVTFAPRMDFVAAVARVTRHSSPKGWI